MSLFYKLKGGKLLDKIVVSEWNINKNSKECQNN